MSSQKAQPNHPNHRQDVFSEHPWWGQNTAFQTLHDINPLRLKLVQQHSGNLKQSKQPKRQKVLDWGCGGGIFSTAMAEQGAVVTGYDPNATALAAAKQQAAEKKLNINYLSDSNQIPNGAFDVVCCFEVLEHVDDPAAMITDLSMKLRPGGYLYLSTINRTLKAWMGMIAGLEVLARALPLGTHQYDQFITPEELCRWCRDSYCSIVDVVGLNYSFFGKYYHFSSTAMPVNYFVVARLKAE